MATMETRKRKQWKVIGAEPVELRELREGDFYVEEFQLEKHQIVLENMIRIKLEKFKSMNAWGTRLNSFPSTKVRRIVELR